MQHKAQSAIEFISSYGFSFLIIIIAISVLFIFTSLPRKILPDYCNFYGGFTCADVLYTNTSTGSSLVVAAVASQPGIVNASNFTATLNYQHSVSGYCTPSYALAGQRIYCIANFTFNGTYGTPYIGTFTIQSNYCANPPGNVSTAACAASTTYNFSGNVRAEMSNVNISGSHTLSVTITNTQGSAVPAQFQQMLQFAPSTYQLYERSDLGNIRFYYKNRELYSWCETNCTSTSTSNAIFWMKLPTAVPASANIILTMQFLPRSVSYGDGYAGEAPQLSPSYAQYDNGASIFDFYDDFATNTLSNYVTGGSGKYSISDGLNINGTGCASSIIAPTSQTPKSSYVVTIYGETTKWMCLQSHTVLFGPAGLQTTKASTSSGYAAVIGQTISGEFDGVERISGTILSSDYTFGSTTGIYYLLQGYFSPGNITSAVNYVSHATSTDTTYKDGYFAIRSYSLNDFIRYWYVRQYPPNGVMPTYSIS